MLGADLAENGGWFAPWENSCCCLFGARAGEANALQLAEREADPPCPSQCCIRLPCARLLFHQRRSAALAALRKKGLLQVAAFTPSDAAHVLDLQDNWSKDAAKLAAQIYCRFPRYEGRPRMSGCRLSAMKCGARTVSLSCKVMIDAALSPLDISSPLIEAVVCREHLASGFADLRISPKVPLVAVGGAGARVLWRGWQNGCRPR